MLNYDMVYTMVTIAGIGAIAAGIAAVCIVFWILFTKQYEKWQISSEQKLQTASENANYQVQTLSDETELIKRKVAELEQKTEESEKVLTELKKLLTSKRISRHE